MPHPVHYYNDNDPYIVRWIENLIAARLIPLGVTDSRSIREVDPCDLEGFVQCHFFAGICGWPRALQLSGWPEDREIWTGSCPCQPFSVAGRRYGTRDDRHLWPDFYRLIRARQPSIVLGEQVSGRAGYGWLDGVAADLEAEDYAVRAADIPACAVGAPHIRSRIYWVAEPQRRSTERRRLDLAGAEEGVEGEAQERERVWLNTRAGGNSGGLADFPDDGRREVRADAGGIAAGGRALGRAAGSGLRGSSGQSERLDYAATSGRSRPHGTSKQECGSGQGCNLNPWADFSIVQCLDGRARRIPVEPEFFPLAHGVPARVGRLRAYGNAISPPLAAEFIRALLDCRP